MERKINFELLLRHLDGNCSHEEEKILNDWLEVNTKNREYFNDIKKIWNTPDNPLPPPDLELAWWNVKHKAGIKEQEKDKILNFERKENSATIKKKIFRSRIFHAAAALLLAIMIPYLIWELTVIPEMNEIRVGNTQQERIILPDGSQLTLDAGSIFKNPVEFSNGRREVYLNGEGYFKVTLDPDRPFIIHANDAIITVLGTEFNIRAWRQNKRVTVAVVKGKVAFRAAQNEDPAAQVIINKNQVSTIYENKNPSLPKYSDINSYISWMHREIYFQSATLQEVLNQLQRWYDIEFELPDEQSATHLITIFIENKPIEEIIDVITLINGFQYRQDGKKIYFYTDK
jgi:ferric-dicitrate binding protein FerR (iron transport regulator)